MGLLQAALRTYESQAHLAGVPVEGKETLTPISHTIQKAQIEIIIDEDGSFREAKPVPKAQSRTIIPVTEESAGRTSGKGRSHPLSDQLQYLSPINEDHHKAYLELLGRWAQSEYSHPKVRAVLRYIQGGTILKDLCAAGVISLEEDGTLAGGKIEGSEYEKCLVRWRVMPPPERGSSACWEDQSLFEAYISFYHSLQSGEELEYCVLYGERDIPAQSHPKGVVSANFGAKLISANDGSGFTYRGRFADTSQTGSVGYTASQKAHSALRWVAANHGVVMGGRTFLWWNPGGKPLPSPDFLGMESELEQQTTFVGYKRQLLDTLSGYQLNLKDQDDVIVAALDAATTGRLSVTYYNELRANDFFLRLQRWYLSCCWETRYKGMWSPPLKQIVRCAYGTQRENFIEVDDRILREHIQRLLHCILDCQKIPHDMVQALVSKASCPLAYKPGNRELLLTTACAIVRKYENEKSGENKKEVWTLNLDENNHDRSYLFGRLLAVAEQVERSTYSLDEKREPNAIRMQSVFSQRPLYAWRILEEALNPYYQRLAPGLRYYYRNITQEITENLPAGDSDLDKKLDDVYLLGYYHQRSAMTKKKDKNVTEDESNESAE